MCRSAAYDPEKARASRRNEWTEQKIRPNMIPQIWLPNYTRDTTCSTITTIMHRMDSRKCRCNCRSLQKVPKSRFPWSCTRCSPMSITKESMKMWWAGCPMEDRSACTNLLILWKRSCQCSSSRQSGRAFNGSWICMVFSGWRVDWMLARIIMKCFCMDGIFYVIASGDRRSRAPVSRRRAIRRRNQISTRWLFWVMIIHHEWKGSYYRRRNLLVNRNWIARSNQ